MVVVTFHFCLAMSNLLFDGWLYPVIPFCTCTDSSLLALLNSSCPYGFSSHQSLQTHQVLVNPSGFGAWGRNTQQKGKNMGG